MAKYMFEVNYTHQGVQGLQKEGGVSRRETIDKLIANMGGQLESFYYSFGDRDAYVTADFPGNVDVAALAITIAGAGAATTKTNVLLTPEEIDEATKRTVEYRPPGA